MEATKEPALTAAPAIDLSATPAEVSAQPAAAERAEPPKLAEAPQLAAVIVAETPARPSASQESAPTGEPAGTEAAPLRIAAVTEAPAAMSDATPVVPTISSASAPDAAPAAAAVTAAPIVTIPASDTNAPSAAAPTPVASAPVIAIPRRGRPTGLNTSVQPRAGSRFGLLAACVALAACMGAAGGAATVAGVTNWAAASAPASKVAAASRSESADEVKNLRETVAQLRAGLKTMTDAVGALRSGSDSTGKATQAQLAKLNEAVDRLERSQVEPQARLARLAEAVDRLERRNAPQQHAAAQQPAAPAPAVETTGSVKPPPLPPLNADTRTGKPVIEGWTLRSVYEGIALVQNKQYGSYEVEVGDEILGAGTVQNIKRQDGKWVVVTNRGVIVPATSVR